MSDAVKIALIVALAIIVACGMFIYFSPFHSCVRAVGSTDEATALCAKATGN